MTIARITDHQRDELVATRRLLHREPELGFQEIKTAAFVAASLRDISGIEDIREGVGQTGVTAVIRGAQPGPTLLLRADIDALPIREATGLPYASVHDGVMHSCGHDGHTAILLMVAQLLAARRDELNGTAFLVFQPAEELGAGAKAMIEDGLWDLAGGPVAATLGLHLIAPLPLGIIGVRSGATFASADGFGIMIKGQGGHGAMPHLSRDPVMTAAETVLSLQRIISRELPAGGRVAISVCQMQAGSSWNVIPDTVELGGTIRTFSPSTRQAVAEKMERIVAGVAMAGGVEYELRIEAGPPAVVNDPEMCDLVRRVAAEIVGPSNVIEPDPMPVSDDISLFLEHAPGCYIMVGAGDPTRELNAGHHHPRFDIAEDALPIGAAVLASAAFRYLSPPV